jgi:glutamate/tyrosine decarboxylase-like PLP-dependent enzyme
VTTRDLLHDTADLIVDFVDGLPDRPVGARASIEDLRARLGGPVPEGTTDPGRVIAELASAVDDGLVATAGPRFFGFVIGGSTPASLAADMLASGWDQNAGLTAAAPGAALIEDIAGEWLLDILGLPRDSSFAFVTGATMANFTALAAARNHVLAEAGWDVESDGLQGAPTVNVVVGEERHITVDAGLKLLGLGTSRSAVARADDQGRMTVDGLREALEGLSGPTIVVAQAGNVNSGSVDPLRDICAIAHDRAAWVHVDGAFGLWLAVDPARKHLLEGYELADSWSTDAHKWLNVPYDCGVAITTHPRSHQAAMGVQASYLVRGSEDGAREPMDFVPEFSRRARALPVYAAIRSLGRSGIREMVENCCRHAARFAQLLGDTPGITILNDIVMNQVLVRFDDDDTTTNQVIRRVQEEGTLWLGGTTWKGRAAMRISVSNWSTTSEDVDRSADAIIRCYRSLG